MNSYRDVIINTDADFLAYAASPSALPTRLVFKRNKITLPPTGVTLRNVRDLYLDGFTAPRGRLLITGGRLTILGGENVTLTRIGLRSRRLFQPMPPGLFDTYERSWKPLAIAAETPMSPCKNITLRECSFSGHTDEIEVGPANHTQWFTSWMGRNAAIGVTFDRCIIGPSFTNTGETILNNTKRLAFLRERERHNMGLSAVCCDDVLITKCLFVGHNRRSPQLQATHARVEHCVMNNWGTMCIGVHAGSNVQINACHFLRGPQTPRSEKAISLVEQTFTSPFGKLGPATIAIPPNNLEFNAYRVAIRSGWHLWAEPTTTQGTQWIAADAGMVQRRPINEIIDEAGCGDALDQAIQATLRNSKHVPWMTDYSRAFPFPGVV